MKAILFDANYCVGCEACMEACQAENGLPEDADYGLSEDRYTSLEEHDDLYLRRMCMHCVEPSCASVCPVGALKKTPEGPVAYEFDKCMGCRYCMVACPFEMPRYEWSSRLPRVKKCQMCSSRVSQGGVTACSEACPAEATLFGERSEMIAEAWRRIADDPENYAQKVYGADEAGGTCVLVIGPQSLLDEAFDPRVPHESLPEKTWVVLSQIPTAVGVAGVTMLGVNWIIRRRMKMMGENATEGHASEDQGGER